MRGRDGETGELARQSPRLGIAESFYREKLGDVTELRLLMASWKVAVLVGDVSFAGEGLVLVLVGCGVKLARTRRDLAHLPI